jgi:hypothetical protein
MHSPVPRRAKKKSARKRGRSRERAEGRQLPGVLALVQQLTRALALIRPTSEEHEACSNMVRTTIDMVEYVRREEIDFDPVGVDRVVEALGRAEATLIQYEARVKGLSDILPESLLKVICSSNYDSELLGRIKKQRECLEHTFGKEARRPLGRRSHAKHTATNLAWVLLRTFGPQQPGLTEGGTWHKLSAVLFGLATADSFSFDYLRGVTHQLRLQHRTPQV